MDEQTGTAVPKSFWIVGALGLLWNLAGVGSFFDELNSGRLAAMATWGAAAFGVAVFGGALGCFLLLLKKGLARLVLIASLVGVIVQMFYNVVISKTITVYGPFEITMSIMIPLIAVFLIWFARAAIQKGWIS